MDQPPAKRSKFVTVFSEAILPSLIALVLTAGIAFIAVGWWILPNVDAFGDLMNEVVSNTVVAKEQVFSRTASLGAVFAALGIVLFLATHNRGL